MQSLSVMVTCFADDGDHFGISVANIGDLDGNGISDLAVGADRDDDGGIDRGAVHLLFLKSDGRVLSSNKISNFLGIASPVLVNFDRFGYSVSRASSPVEVTSGEVNFVTPGTYVTTEIQKPGYAFTGFTGDCAPNGTMIVGSGDSFTCTLTNNDIPSTITIQKNLINDDEGTLTADQFVYRIDAGSPNEVVVLRDTPIEVTPNVVHTVSEDSDAGYTTTIGDQACNPDGTITLAQGETGICIITNDDVNTPPVLDPIGPQSVTEGVPLNIVLSAIDAGSGNSLTYTATGLPSFAKFVGDGDLLSVAKGDALLRTINPNDASTISAVTMALPGKTINGATGLAIQPGTDVLYAMLKASGSSGRVLATIDPSTCVATEIGATGDSFAGIAFFDQTTLFGVTGDGASTPETLFTLSLTDALPTPVCALGNGDDGEAIGFNPDDDKLYHASGFSAIFEKIITLSGASCSTVDIFLTDPDDFSIKEILALTYSESQSEFLASDFDDNLHIFPASGGASVILGVLDHVAKGLAFVPNVSSFSGNPATLLIEPGIGDVGSFSINIQVTDIGSPPLSDSETFSLDVLSGNTAPVANDDAITAPENGSITADVLANDGSPVAVYVRELPKLESVL